MRLLAISDIHLGYKVNLEALHALPPHPQDWLIVAGDIGETEAQLRECCALLSSRFRKVLWVPGNHELYVLRSDPCQLRGQKRYAHMVEVCRGYGVITPEDPYPVWPGAGPPRCIVPTFVPYDYSFAPDGLNPSAARAWAAEAGIVCADERFLHTDPFLTMEDWCADRVAYTESRLGQIPEGFRWILINHFPLRRDLVRLYRIPRFIPWCGTRKTEDWHQRYPLEVVVTGHLHMRATDWRDGTRFEEVSLGYPRHWRQERKMQGYLRQILPGPPTPSQDNAGPIWHP